MMQCEMKAIASRVLRVACSVLGMISHKLGDKKEWSTIHRMVFPHVPDVTESPQYLSTIVLPLLTGLAGLPEEV